MAITRADLEIRKGLFSGKVSNSLIIVGTLLLGFIAFAFCLIAETARTQVLWTSMSVPSLLDTDAYTDMKCSYSKAGSAALACALGALIAMVISLALALSRKNSEEIIQPLSIWNTSTTVTSALRWTSFAVAAALLLIGIILEAGIVFESSRRTEPRDQCLVVSQGLFTGAGIFALVSTSAMSAFYIAALHAVKLEQRTQAANQELSTTVGGESNTRAAETSTIVNDEDAPPPSPPLSSIATATASSANPKGV
ncbi:uncharacterized protein LOC9630345 [Selaginella moellendorffii]|uniref:uncharacterized protein LOC9630345 n=1 Tax=Selaginella moellendorffii TaxID=88036 RepID=UPI000D1C79AD|nr:uncharacterized protein LOC9630345 [Selaginella moellendorffii]|eukprot:XP_024519503.1 uncharacterized protein LOC9630345 [Selaginella moellendorffii]